MAIPSRTIVAEKMAYTDAELCELLQKGSQKAFLEIYDRYKERLYQYAYRKISDPRDVEDLLQELFVRLWEQREFIHIDANLPGYLYIALRNSIFNYYIREKRQSEFMRSLSMYMEEWADDVDYTVRENELSSVIQQEIDRLPPKMREVFLLHRNAEMTYQEIAEKTGTSVHTVATQIKNTLRKLRTRLRDFRLFSFFIY